MLSINSFRSQYADARFQADDKATREAFGNLDYRHFKGQMKVRRSLRCTPDEMGRRLVIEVIEAREGRWNFVCEIPFG